RVPVTGGDGGGKDEARPLVRLVERDGAVDGHGAVAGEGRALDGKLGRVAHDLGDGGLHLYRDHGLPREGGGGEIGLEPQIVALGHDSGGKPGGPGGRSYQQRPAPHLTSPPSHPPPPPVPFTP